jgi:hypothetical protein
MAMASANRITPEIHIYAVRGDRALFNKRREKGRVLEDGAIRQEAGYDVHEREGGMMDENINRPCTTEQHVLDARIPHNQFGRGSSGKPVRICLQRNIAGKVCIQGPGGL